MENFKTSADVLFILLGAIMILAMHAGFAFLELGTVRRKNQVNALVKILCDFSVSTIAWSASTRVTLPIMPLDRTTVSPRFRPATSA